MRVMNLSQFLRLSEIIYLSCENLIELFSIIPSQLIFNISDK